MNLSIYDATLRDGAQGEGISFSESGKIQFVHLLDEFGVEFIEGGFAGSNPRDRRLFEEFKRHPLPHAHIVAFGSTRRVELDVQDDPQITDLLRAETEFITIYGKTSLLHIQTVLGTTLERNLQMIADTVGYLHQAGRKVFFDAEHFYDAMKDDSAYAMRVLETAFREGASGVVLCDTNGGTLPHDIFEITQQVRNAFPEKCVGVHTHNDNAMAVANALEGVRAGANMVQGCINGYGERAGNADLISIIPALEMKMNQPCIRPGQLRRLCEVSRITDDLANRRPDPRQPYVGRNAFSHKAGAHVNAVRKDPHTFEHIDPASIGNSRRILVSELSGVSNILLKAKELGEDLSQKEKSELRLILDKIKQQENLGYSYESADGSLKILLRKILKEHTAKFEFDGFRVIIEKRGRDEPCISEATIKVKVNGETELTAGEGEGPVDALNSALRKALIRFYPEISKMSLTDYRVRILDPAAATRATTRVLIESGDGTQQWGTVGVSENIIEASWQALLDSVEFQLIDKDSK